MALNKNNYCLIMAGGIGSRFWPLSRASHPKQFLDILGVGTSLLQQTFARFSKVVPKKNIFVITNAEYKDITLSCIDIKADHILLEPLRRNTALCIAYACHRIGMENPEANIVVTPADHLVRNEKVFLDTIRRGLEFSAQRDALLTIGITPSRPDTGYGYIQFNRNSSDSAFPDIREVRTFTEKPDLPTAKSFLRSGEFLWNSGMFFWSLQSILTAFEFYMPDTCALFQEYAAQLGTPEESGAIRDIYERSRNISIDYAIMEKADNVYVLPSDFGWSDIGTWGSLYANLPKDNNQNAMVGKQAFLYDTKGCLIDIPNDRLAVIQGMEDMIVVLSDDVLLICRKEEEQRIKDFVNEIKLRSGSRYI